MIAMTMHILGQCTVLVKKITLSEAIGNIKVEILV